VIHPDIQYMPLNAQNLPVEKAVEAKYWITNLMRPFTQAQQAIYDRAWNGATTVGRTLTPTLYDKLRSARNWWQDSDIIPGAVDVIDNVLTSAGLDEFSPAKLDFFQTHWGEMTWLHAMPDKDTPNSAREFQQRLADYVAAQIAEYRRLLDAGDPYRAGFELGKAMHLIHDSYSPSHTVRDADGVIQRYQFFGAQSPALHKKEDNIDQHSPLFRKVQKVTADLVTLANDRSISGDGLTNTIKTQFLPTKTDAIVGGTDPNLEPRK
jgi:hypothetical protein